MPASPLAADVGSSLDFGLDNNLRQTKVFSNTAVGSWGTSNTLSPGATTNMAVLSFTCRIPVDHIGTASYDSHSTTLFQTTLNGGAYIKCVYYGARAPELAYRNRICFFGSDGANALGRVPPMVETPLVADGAVRSPQLLDTQPRQVQLRLINDGAGNITVRVLMQQPGTTTLETGDIQTTTFLLASLGPLHVGGPPTLTSVVGDYFCGEVSRMLFGNNVTNPTAMYLPPDVRGIVPNSTDMTYPFTSSILYWRLDGTMSGSSAYFGSSNVRLGRRHLPYSLGVPGSESAFVVVSPDPGKVLASANGTVSFQVRYRELSNDGFNFFYLLLVNEAGVTQAISSQVAMTAIPFGTYGTATVSFTNVPAGWYSIQGQWRSSLLQEDRWTASGVFGVGERVWVLGDATLQKFVDNTDVSLSSPVVAGVPLTENVTVTVAEQYATGHFRKPRTVTRADFNQARLAMLKSALPSFNTFSAIPTEYVILATTGDSLDDWVNNRQTQGVTYLLSEYGQAFSNHSSFCTEWVVANDTAGQVASQAQLETPTYHSGVLDQLFGNIAAPSLRNLVNNTVAPVHVIPGHRHQSTFLTLPVPGELTELQVAAMRQGRLNWLTSNLAPLRYQIGPWWSYGAAYNPAFLTTVPTSSADWQDAASSFADALLGKHAGGGLTAKFGSSARNTILIEDTSGIFGTLTNSNTTQIAISDNGGGFYTSLGYTTIIAGNIITLAKTTGDWASVLPGQMRVRYGYGFPLFQPTYPTSASAITLQNYYQSKQGVLFENSAQTPFRAFDLLVDLPTGGSGGVRLLAMLGAGK